MKRRKEENENYQERHRDDDQQTIAPTFKVLPEPAPGHQVSRRQLYLIPDFPLRLFDEAAHVGATYIRLYGDAALPILPTDLNWSFFACEVRQLGQRNALARWRTDEEISELPRIGTELARQPHDQIKIDESRRVSGPLLCLPQQFESLSVHPLH
ncbi:MAG: hypothetical protein JWO80_1896 [Bryobacterales bacterium]|nr:hypothetical protein [Bryobacterales bacterium]